MRISKEEARLLHESPRGGRGAKMAGGALRVAAAPVKAVGAVAHGAHRVVRIATFPVRLAMKLPFILGGLAVMGALAAYLAFFTGFGSGLLFPLKGEHSAEARTDILLMSENAGNAMAVFDLDHHERKMALRVVARHGAGLLGARLDAERETGHEPQYFVQLDQASFDQVMQSVARGGDGARLDAFGVLSLAASMSGHVQTDLRARDVARLAQLARAYGGDQLAAGAADLLHQVQGVSGAAGK